MIYLNHAASGLMPDGSVHAITQHLQAEQARGPYLAAADAAAETQQLYALLADLLHCQPADIAITTGNSHGWNSVLAAMPWLPGDKVLIAQGEWGGNVAMLEQLSQRCGIAIEALPETPQGELDMPQLALRLAQDRRIKLVALTWVPANGATIYPAEAVGAVCAQHGVAYVVDAAQALGHIPVDVQALQCDALTAPGRKWLCGPRGTGVLYVRPGFLPQLQPMMVDHQSCPITSNGPQRRLDAAVFESAERSVALQLGLKAALENTLATGGWAARFAALAHSGGHLRQALASLPHVQLHDRNAAASDCALVAFSVAGYTARQVQQLLLRQGISVAVSGMGFTPRDMQSRGLRSVVRASVGWQTSEADLAALRTALEAMADAGAAPAAA